VKSGTAQSGFAICNRLAAIPVVCLSGCLNKTLIVRQNWIAGSRTSPERPELPSRGASQVMSLSSQISNEPRVVSEAVQLDKFVVRWRAGNALLIPPD
jgi:hypothetical protein